MKQIDALARLYAIQGWLHLPLSPTGKPYGPGFIRNRDWFSKLQWQNRRVSFRLRKYGYCLACNKPVSESSTGDHLVPVSLGGPDNASNYIPLCGKCNSLKGSKDFLKWWIYNGYDLKDLKTPTVDGVPVLADLLCAYARLTYQSAKESGCLHEEAPKHQVDALEQLRPILPKTHWKAITEIEVSK